MISVERTDDEKAAERARDMFPAVISEMPDVPPGLCICLTETELAKLGLEADCDVGDMIHLFAMAKVTSVSATDTGSGTRCRIELAITDLAVEDEDDEEEPDEDDD